MPVDAAIICEFDEGIGHEFSPLVILQCLDFCLKLVLCKCLVGLKAPNVLLFRLRHIASSTVGGCIINEGHPVAVFFMCCNRERSMQIHVDKLKLVVE